MSNVKHSLRVIDYMSQGLQIEEIIDFFNMQIQYEAINRHQLHQYEI